MKCAAVPKPKLFHQLNTPFSVGYSVPRCRKFHAKDVLEEAVQHVRVDSLNTNSIFYPLYDPTVTSVSHFRSFLQVL